jgi:hypothetical protein
MVEVALILTGTVSEVADKIGGQERYHRKQLATQQSIHYRIGAIALISS